MSRKTVLVTGGAGFIGSNIVAELCDAGKWDVVVCDRLRDADSGKWRNIAKHPIADYCAPEQMFDWLEANARQVEAVVHMGAISSTTEPDADAIVQNNFVLSRELWQWCLRQDVRLIYASSAATYGGGEWGFADSDDPQVLARLRPLNAYGWSKWLFDLYAMRALEAGEGPPQVVGLKFFNVYGPNEAHKGAMKSVAAQKWSQAKAGEPITLFKSHRDGVEDGGQRRDFVYVRDAAQVAAWLLDHPRVEGLFNLGSGQARSFADLTRALYAAAEQTPDIRYVDTPEAIRDHYQYYTQAEMSRLKAAGYDRPFTTLEDGIGDYVRQYLSQPDPYR
jgi:ADP-L-glycero-D-manno-heptose 6-epimerase